MSKIRFSVFAFAFLILTAFLTACSGGVLPSGWPGMMVSKNADNKDVAYLASTTFIYSIDISNGTQIWRYPTDKAVNSKTFYAAPVLTLDQKQLLAPSYDHKLYSLNPVPQPTADGKLVIVENWIFTGAKNRYIASPLVTETGIYAPNSDGSLYALDFSGVQRWAFKTPKPLWAQPVIDATGETIYVSSMDHHIYAISAADGKQIWISSDLGGALVSTPTLSPDGILYLGSFSNEMFAIDAKDGSIKWRTPTSGWVWSSPALDKGTLYFGDMGGDFFALDAVSGAVKWKISPKSAIVSPPLITSSAIYYGTEANSVNAIDLEGKPLWTYQPDAATAVYASVLMSGDLLLVAPNGGKNPLIALNTSGTLKWTFTPAK